jgi:ABC-type phosphate/phosphonate transport system permease subunit
LKWEMLGGLLIIIFLIVYSIELLAGWVRKRII